MVFERVTDTFKISTMKMLLFLCLLTKTALGASMKDRIPMENRFLNLFEGDILLRNGTSLTSFQDRNAMTNRRGRWGDGVVIYQFDETYTESDKEVIRSAIAEFEEHTCIKWVERTDEEVYVEIENDMGCWSELGRIGGVQSLSLEAPICMKKGVIMHEMMHTLGFLHEHTRPDRDDYVQVMWDNIVSGMEPNFQKLSPLQLDDLGMSYDYRSIMHYSAYMFANDRSYPTLKPLESGVHTSDLGYGQSEGAFTNTDIEKIKKFYQC